MKTFRQGAFDGVCRAVSSHAGLSGAVRESETEPKRKRLTERHCCLYQILSQHGSRTLTISKTSSGQLVSLFLRFPVCVVTSEVTYPHLEAVVKSKMENSQILKS